MTILLKKALHSSSKEIKIKIANLYTQSPWTAHSGPYLEWQRFESMSRKVIHPYQGIKISIFT